MLLMVKTCMLAMLALSVPRDYYIAADFTHIFTFYSVHMPKAISNSQDDTFKKDSLSPLDVNTVHLWDPVTRPMYTRFHGLP